MSGAAARESMKRLMEKPASDGRAPSAAPMAARAGRLMSMPKDGTEARRPSSKVKAKEVG
jgi:hypothetical protein